MTSCHWPLFETRSLAMNLFELGGLGGGGRWSGTTAGGVKDQLRSRPSAATKGAAARRLGKVRQSKSILGPVKHRPGVQWGGGGRSGTERVRAAVLACKLAKTLALTPQWGVRKKKKKTSSRGHDEDDDTPTDVAPERSRSGSLETHQLSVMASLGSLKVAPRQSAGRANVCVREET